MPRLLPNSIRTEATTAKNGKGRRCYRCNSEFHLAKQCDVNPPSGRADPWRPTRVSRLSNLGTHYYLPTTFTKGGQTFDSLVLIDSGSGVQIMPHTMLKWATSPLRQVKKRVYSASGDRIEIIGAATVRYIVDGIKMSSEFLFSPHISECIVGLPWLVENDATWHVAQGVLNIRGRQVRLVHGPDETRVRRIFAAEDVRIKPKTVTVIPVRMPLDVISSTDADWSTQAKTIGRSVILPRCLLSNRINYMQVRAASNSSKRPQAKKLVRRDKAKRSKAADATLSGQPGARASSKASPADSAGRYGAAHAQQQAGAGDDREADVSREHARDGPSTHISPTRVQPHQVTQLLAGELNSTGSGRSVQSRCTQTAPGIGTHRQDGEDDGNGGSAELSPKHARRTVGCEGHGGTGDQRQTDRRRADAEPDLRPSDSEQSVLYEKTAVYGQAKQSSAQGARTNAARGREHGSSLLDVQDDRARTPTSEPAHLSNRNLINIQQLENRRRTMVVNVEKLKKFSSGVASRDNRPTQQAQPQQ
jgi:hypothetical protein